MMGRVFFSAVEFFIVLYSNRKRLLIFLRKVSSKFKSVRLRGRQLFLVESTKVELIEMFLVNVGKTKLRVRERDGP